MAAPIKPPTPSWIIGENVPWSSAWTVEIEFHVVPSRDFPGMLDLIQKEAQGEGEPLFAAMHLMRQRRAMMQHLCHVCGKRTPPDDRWLFPLQSGGMVPMGDGTQLYGGNVPPVHLKCALNAKVLCPHLRKSQGRPVRFPKDEGRLLPRTDVTPDMEQVARSLPPGLPVIYSCYRLHGRTFTKVVERLMARP